jgi:hypothetical protein
MARPSKLYVPLDVDFPDDTAVIEAGEGAEILYIHALCFSKRTGSDGFISESQLGRLSTHSGRRAAKLVSVGLFEKVEGGYRIRGWSKWNPSQAELEDKKARQRKAAVQTNHNRYHKDDPHPDCELCYTSLDRSVDRTLERPLERSMDRTVSVTLSEAKRSNSEVNAKRSEDEAKLSDDDDPPASDREGTVWRAARQLAMLKLLRQKDDGKVVRDVRKLSKLVAEEDFLELATECATANPGWKWDSIVTSINRSHPNGKQRSGEVLANVEYSRFDYNGRPTAPAR